MTADLDVDAFDLRSFHPVTPRGRAVLEAAKCAMHAARRRRATSEARQPAPHVSRLHVSRSAPAPRPRPQRERSADGGPTVIERITRHLQEHGPATTREITAALSADYETVRAKLKPGARPPHITVLAVRHNGGRGENVYGLTDYGLSGQAAPGDVRPTTDRIVAYVAEHGPATGPEIAEALRGRGEPTE